MKKLFLILAFVSVYGIVAAGTPVKSVSEKAGKVTVSVDTQSNFNLPDEEKDKKKKTEEKTTATEKEKEVKQTTGCGDAQKKSCATAGKTCPGQKAATEKKTGGGTK